MRDTSRPLPFLSAARGVFDLSLDGMLWSRRTVMMAALLGIPILFALFYRLMVARVPPQLGGFDAYALIVVFFYVGNIVPLLALFYGTSLVADEVEGKTLTYLLTRPIRREAILVGKFAAYLATIFTLTLPGVVVTFFLLATARGWAGISGVVPDLFRDLAVVALTGAVYGAFFMLLGVGLRRPVIPGLLFVLIWELVVHVPGYLPRLTINAWLRSLIRHRPADEGLAEMFGAVLPAALSLEVLAGMLVIFLAGSIWIFSTRQYVMEQ